jgi:hypothetical protein
MRAFLLSLAILACTSSMPGLDQWCYEGSCASDCPFTRYAPRYDWMWCGCPTSSECAQDPNQTCNRCYTDGLTWCDDPWDPYCHTYYLSGYDQFCGCEYGIADAGALEPYSNVGGTQ